MSRYGDLRVSDADRERAFEALRTHAGAGRLTVEELEERTDAALAARTERELREVLRDLPAGRAPAGRARMELPSDPGLRSHLTVFVAVNCMLIAIWALTGMGYFWPVWPLLGWGIGLVCHAGGSRGRSTKMARATRASRTSSTRPSTLQAPATTSRGGDVRRPPSVRRQGPGR